MASEAELDRIADVIDAAAATLLREGHPPRRVVTGMIAHAASLAAKHGFARALPRVLRLSQQAVARIVNRCPPN